MSVLKLRRDMVVVDDETATETVAEIDRPFPLRKIEPEAVDIIEAELAEVPAEHEGGEHHGRTFFEHVRWWFNAAIVVAAVGAYPAMVIASSDVGDANISGLTNRADWTAPWVGGSATLLEKHFDQLGWASDAPAWTPMARLTAKPAYQTALAGSLGDFVKLMNTQAIAVGHSDPDLEAAARLVSSASTAIQLRAARDALTNYDRRMRRRDVASMSTPQQVVQQIGLITTWAGVSQEEIAASAKSVGGSPIDEDATRAVYTAKARAMVAFLILDSLQWPESPEAAKARTAALEAWKAAAQFHPLVVLNGDPDGSVFGNHPASMGFLIGQAQKATEAFEASLGLGSAPGAGPPAPLGQPVPTAAATGAAK